MNYDASRQLAGISGSGLLFLLASICFVYQFPSTFFPFHGGPFYADWAALWAFYLVYSAISLPFDIWAGYWAPCRHHGHCQIFPVYLGHLFRAVFVQGLIMTVSALLLLEAGKLSGRWAAVATFAVLLALLHIARPRLSALLGAAPPSPLSARQSLLAAAWLLAGFVLCTALPWCGVHTLYFLLETLLGCSIWTLLGLVLLRLLDPLAPRVALFYSWACFGLLSRATPSNAGRPELWAAAPAD